MQLQKLVRAAANQSLNRMDNFARQYDLTGLQMSVIDFLSNRPNYQATQHEIEVEFGIQRSTTTVMIQRMEKRNLVTRFYAEDDHRQKQVQLTKKAIELIKKVHAFIAQDQHDLEARYTSTELNVIADFLNYLSQKK